MARRLVSDQTPPQVLNAARPQIWFGAAAASPEEGPPPAIITLSNMFIAEDAAIGTDVGTLGILNATGTPVFTLVDNAGGKFAKFGTNIIETAAALDYETAQSHNIVVGVSGTTPAIANMTLTINVTNIIEAPVNSVAPTVSPSSINVGQVVTCTTGTWSLSPTSYAYQWMRGGADISGATASSYTAVALDDLSTLTCKVRASNADGPAAAYVASSNSCAVGVTAAALLLGAELSGVAWSASDDSMEVRDTTTPSNNYVGRAVPKWGNSRISGALLHDSTGKLVWGPENLIAFSEDLSNAAWMLASITIGSNAIAGPDGRVVADAVIPVAGTNACALMRSEASNMFVGPNTISYFLKNGTLGTNWVYIVAFSPSPVYSWFNLATGAKGTSTGSPISYNIVALANGWYRVDMTMQFGSAAADIMLAPANGDGLSTATVGDGVKPAFYVGGFQVNRGLVPAIYLLTTSSPSYGIRRDYDPRLGGVPKYLCEAAATNLILNSEDYSNAGQWQPNEVTRTPNATVAPDGKTTASLLTPTVASNVHRIAQSVSHAAGRNVVSMFVKPHGYTKCGIRENSTTGNGCSFNCVGAGAIMDLRGPGATAYITAYPNGWYRVSINYAASAASEAMTFFVLDNAYSSGELWSYNYSGNGVDGVYFWGMQDEPIGIAGIGPSSYIPTIASVTRGVDKPALPQAQFKYVQATNTIYSNSTIAHQEITNALRVAVALSWYPGGGHALVNSYWNADVFPYVLSGNVGQTDFTFLGGATLLTDHKMAVAAADNDMSGAFNGVLKPLDTSGGAPQTFGDPMVIAMGVAGTGGAWPLNGWVADGMHVPRRMTGNEILVLTGGTVPVGTAADQLLAGETNGFAFAASDNSMTIKDTVTPAHNYAGSLIDYFGPIRISQAKCYGPTGLLEWGPENLVLNANDFSSGNWVKGGIASQVQNAAGIDGKTSAWTLTLDTGGGEHRTYSNIANCKYYSVYAKAGTAGFLAITPSGVSTTYAAFDLVAGTVAASAGVVATITPAANGFYRCMIETPTLSGSFIILNVGSSAANCVPGVTWTAAGQTIILTRAQVERLSSSHLYVDSGYGIRRDYDPRLGTGKPKYLREAEATNLILYSEDFSQWAPNNVSVPVNQITAPDGNLTADMLTAVGGDCYVYQGLTLSAGVNTWSCFFKKGTANFARISANDGGNNWSWFNLNTGLPGTNMAGNTSTMVALPNGWYRCTVTRTVAGSPWFGVAGLSDADNSTSSTAGTTVYLWGYQIEAGGLATSYIPTVGATVKRENDIFPNIPSTAFNLSQTAGMIYAEYAFYLVVTWQGIMSLYSGSGESDTIWLRDYSAVHSQGGILKAGVEQFATYPGQPALYATDKIAITYAPNDAAFSRNGAAVIIDPDGIVALPPVDGMALFSVRNYNFNSGLYGWMGAMAHVPRRITNAELVTRTTL